MFQQSNFVWKWMVFISQCGSLVRIGKDVVVMSWWCSMVMFVVSPPSLIHLDWFYSSLKIDGVLPFWTRRVHHVMPLSWTAYHLMNDAWCVFWSWLCIRIVLGIVNGIGVFLLEFAILSQQAFWKQTLFHFTTLVRWTLTLRQKFTLIFPMGKH